MTYTPPEFPRLTGHDTVALDLETRDPDLEETGPGWPFRALGEKSGHVAGVALAWDGGQQSGYWPDTPTLRRYLRTTLRQSSLTMLVHNRSYDEGWLRRMEVPVKCRVHDTRVAAPLLDEYRHSYKLDALAKDYLGAGKDQSTLEAWCKAKNAEAAAEAKLQGLKGAERRSHMKANSWHPKNDLWRMPLEIVAPYARIDAERTWQLWEKMQPLLTREELWTAYQLESDIQPCLIEMRWRGVRVDLDYAEFTFHELGKEVAACQKKLDEAAGFHVEVWEANSIAKAFDQLHIPYPRTPKTDQPSFRAGYLEGLEHPIAKLLLDVRQLGRVKDVFIGRYVLAKSVDGRLFGEFHPLKSDEGGAVTRRFSSSHPNLQNLPGDRKPRFKEMVRRCFLPEEGQLWCASDYSQQEPRLTVHFAANPKVRAKGAQEAVEAYINDPSLNYHTFMSQLTGLPKPEAKIINLGVGYGMGGAKLCRSLRLPTKWKTIVDRKTGLEREIEVAGDEGQAILDAYHENAPFVKGLFQYCSDKAETRGYIKLLDGGRCRFKREGQKGVLDWPYKGMNRLIQGSAAVQFKMALRAMWQEGIVPLVLVHDEFGNGVNEPKEMHRISEIMATCVPNLRVPFKVDAEIGKSWGEAKLPDLDGGEGMAEFWAGQLRADNEKLGWARHKKAS